MPTASSRRFRAGLQRAYEVQVEGEVLKKKRRVLSHLLRSTSAKMPVDTGRARANTIISIGRRDYTWEEFYDPQGQLNVRAGQVVIGQDRNPYAKAYVQNNVPYILMLESGHSNQAPLGVFAVATAELGVMNL